MFKMYYMYTLFQKNYFLYRKQIYLINTSNHLRDTYNGGTSVKPSLWSTLSLLSLGKVLRIRPNTTYRSSTIIFLYTTTCFGCPDQPYSSRFFFMFMFPCIAILYYNNPTRCSCAQSILFHCSFTLHVSGAFHTHHQEYINCIYSL